MATNAIISLLSGFEAVQQIKSLKHINKALDVYSRLHYKERNKYVINAALKLWLKKHSSKHSRALVVALYNDILIHRIPEIDHRILIRCCKITWQFDRTLTLRILRFINTVYSKSVAIDIYARSASKHDLKRALSLFNAIPITQRDTVCVGAMLKCYIRHKQYSDAMDLFEAYRSSADDVCYVLYLSACMKNDAFEKGHHLIEKHLHSLSEQHSYSYNSHLMSKLIDFYGHFGRADRAIQIYDSMPESAANIVCIGAMLKCLVNNGKYDDAITMFEGMPTAPDDICTLLYLKACMNGDAFHKGEQSIELHQTLNFGRAMNVRLKTVQMEFYAHFGQLTKALSLYDEIPSRQRNVVVRSVILNAYVRHQMYDEAIVFYERMPSSIPKDDVCHTLYIKACMGASKRLDRAQELIEKQSKKLYEHSLQFIHTVIDFYGQCGRIDDALKVYDGIPAHKKNIGAVAAVMKMYINAQQCDQALAVFESVDVTQHNDVSMVLLLKACIHANAYETGVRYLDGVCDAEQQQHSIELLTTAIDFHGHFGHVEKAMKLFESIPEQNRNVVCIGAILKCLVHHRRDKDAIVLFENTCARGMVHDDVSHTLFLKACIHAHEFEKGKQIIDQMSQTKSSHSIELKNTVIDFWGQFGRLEQAKNMFEAIPAEQRSVISVDIMLKIYNANEEWQQATDLFDSITETKRDVFSYIAALNSCAGAFAMDKGNQIIADLQKLENTHFWQDHDIQAAVIRFYAKTNQNQFAMDRFNSLKKHESVDTTKLGLIHCAIMDCYAKIGDTKNLLLLFDEIKNGKLVKISDEMYSIVLNGCAHSGLVDDAMAIFADIEYEKHYQLNPQIVTTMVDGLSRHHRLKEAQDLYHAYVNSLDLKAKLVALLSMLSSCRMQNDVDCAQSIFEHICNECLPCVQDGDIAEKSLCANAFVLMSNIYAQNEEFEKSNAIRMQIKEKELELM